jgi:ABC-2 type transport system permease protein
MRSVPMAPERRVPALGGFNLTALGLEVRRVLRNRRTMIFILAMPAVFFLFFGLPYRSQSKDGSILAYIMISMAVYGAMVGTTTCGAAVAVERSLGWSRQLRVTPLRPAAYIAIKVLTAMVVGLVAVVVEYVVGVGAGVRMPVQAWLVSGLAAWLCSLVFAAFGLFIGFLLPSENVMQFVGPLLALLSLCGGLFVPLSLLPHAVQTISRFTPVYGVGQIARSPLVGGFTTTAVLNVAGWTLLFVVGAVRLFRRDTARV